MPTGYTFCIPFKLKSVSNVSKAYIDHVYAKFSGSVKILTENRTGLKNKLFTTIAKQLGVEHKI